MTSKRCQNFILNRKWFEHFSPRDFHIHFEYFDYLFRDYIGRHKNPALLWDAAGVAGGLVKVRVGEPEPVFHFIAVKYGNDWNRFSIPPEKLQIIQPDTRLSVGGESIDIAKTGFLFVAPTFRFEIVTDPHFVDLTQRSASDGHAIYRFDRQQVRQPSLIFSANVNHLVTNKRVHGKYSKPPKYVLYQHMFGDETEYPMNGLFYVGITQRDWKKRWGEHKAAINRGSPLKFHRTFRERLAENRITHIHHKVMEAVDDLKLLYAIEEQTVEGHWEDDRLLNMIPGGEKGLKYLHEHKILNSKVQPMPDYVDAMLEKWVLKNPRKGLPAPWISEKWKDNVWASKVICGRKERLSIEQVRAIRALGNTDLTPDEIAFKVGAKNALQVRKVINRVTYNRVA